METQQLNETLEARGYTLACSKPRPEVRDDDWPSIGYDIMISKNGKPIISIPFFLGVGHVNYREARHVPSKFQDTLFTLQAHPAAQIKDKQRHAELASFLAERTGVKPSLSDVLSSLISDGAAHFDSMSFEDWASDCGHDADSRKAEKIFRQCEEIGKTLMRNLGREEIDKLRELLQDF